MTIEDRVRRVLDEAAASEPPLRGAPLDHALRRPGRRPLLAGALVVVLVVGLVAAVVAVRGTGRPAITPSTTPTTLPTGDWKTHTDDDLRFRYPPDWELRRGGEPRGPIAILVPPEYAGRPLEQVQASIWIDRSSSFWVGDHWQGITRLGRLPGGQAYLYSALDPAAPSLDGRPLPPIAEQARHARWAIDWGRPCSGPARRCAPRTVAVFFGAVNGRLWDRHHQVADTVALTVTRLWPPAMPSAGDRSLPACRPGQWRLVWPEEYGGAYGIPRLGIQGGVQYRAGPRCHLRLSLRMAVEDGGGRLLPIRGNPATTTVEGDLPDDGMRRDSGSWVIGGALMWQFVWDGWCNPGTPEATLRVTAEGGARLTVPGLDPTHRPRLSKGPICGDPLRPPRVAGWP